MAVEINEDTLMESQLFKMLSRHNKMNLSNHTIILLNIFARFSVLLVI